MIHRNTLIRFISYASNKRCTEHLNNNSTFWALLLASLLTTSFQSWHHVGQTRYPHSRVRRLHRRSSSCWRNIQSLRKKSRLTRWWRKNGWRFRYYNAMCVLEILINSAWRMGSHELYCTFVFSSCTNWRHFDFICFLFASNIESFIPFCVCDLRNLTCLLLRTWSIDLFIDSLI